MNYTLKCLQKCEVSEELCSKAFFRYQGSWKPCNHIFIHWSHYIPTYKYHTFLTLKSTWRQKKPTRTAKFMGSSWVLSATGGTHVGPMNLAIRAIKQKLRAAIKFIFFFALIVMHRLCGIVVRRDNWVTFYLCQCCTATLITRFIGPTWGPSGADRTQVGPILAPWTLLSG